MGHEPHAAAVFASQDLKISPVDVAGLVAEHEALPNSFRHIIENLATCISVTTMIACDHQAKNTLQSPIKEEQQKTD
jgi:hypothetical protein